MNTIGETTKEATNSSGCIVLEFIPESSFLLGGVSVNPAYDSSTALDKDNVPYLTATAIKGSIRMEFEALIRGIGEERICDLDDDVKGCNEIKGDHKENDINNVDLNDKSKLCLVCRLFGGGNQEGKLRFNSACIENPDEILPKATRKDLLEKGRREGVAISRTLGKSKDGSYYTSLTFPNLKGITDISFKTHIDIREKLDDTEYKYLSLFFKMIEKTGIAMGARKSSGLGFFKVQSKLPIQQEYKIYPPIAPKNKELKLVKVTLQTLEPLLVGNLKNRYVIDTLPYIPASTLGGTIGFKLSESGVPQKDLEDMFDHNNSFSTFNFYLDRPYPVPLSMRQKKGDEKGSEKDILLPDYVVKEAINKGNFNDKVEELFDVLHKNNLRPVPICKKPETVYNTKIAIGRELQTSSEGLLYSMELIPKDSEFHGFIIGEGWALDSLKEIKTLWMGGKRTRGFGKTVIKKMEVIQVNELLSLGNKDDSIDSCLRNIAGQFSILLPNDRTFFTLDLLSDFAIPEEIRERDRNIEHYLTQMLFEGTELTIEKSFIQIIQRGGYDFRKKKAKPIMERIGAGSTFLVSVPKEKEELFIQHLEKMIDHSTYYKWDSTPLFQLNNPDHENYWRKS